MPRRYTALALASCALNAHCADDTPWALEGRIYVTADVTVTRADATLSKRATEGRVVYQAVLDLAPGVVPPDAGLVQASAHVPLDRPLAAGDVPFLCDYYPDDNGVLENDGRGDNKCTGFDEGPRPAENPWANLDADPWPFGLIYANASRVVFEVVRPADEVAPSLEGEAWRVHVADSVCDGPLEALRRDPACVPGATCVGTVRGETFEYKVDATSCRRRTL
jgi:hypothetical protein